MLLAGSIVTTIAACADRDSLVHRVKNYDVNRTAQAPAEKPEQQAETPSAQQTSENTPQSGPVQLSRPESDDIAKAQTPQPAPTDDRLGFLDWFGNSADPAKVKDPVAELRKARAITAGMTQQPGTQPPPSPQALMISENSRLVPTYRDGLPNPDGTKTDLPPLRGAEITTGSVTPRTKPVTRKSTTTTADLRNYPEKEQLLKVDQQLRQTRDDQDKPSQRYASADPDAVTAVSPHDVPSRDNPVRLHVGLNGGAFDGDDTATLKTIAVLHLRTGRKIHIHGVSRGPAGNSETSVDRVRRLHKHTKRAIAVLTQFGVKAANISTSTAEQRMTGTYVGTSRPKDRERLELSLQ